MFADPVMFQVTIVHYIVDQHTQPHRMPEWSQSGVLAGDVLGSVGVYHPQGARREGLHGEVLGKVLPYISQLHVPQAG